MSYLQFNLMERQRLLGKPAKAAGVAEVKVVWATFNSPAAMNDALLSGSVDIVSGGVPGLLTIWSRTQGTANAVKGIAAFTSQPILLNSRNPNIRGIADFTDQDKIALPAVKVSIQAIILQMAAAEAWGRVNFAKLDPITVGISPPDATVALLSGSGDIASVFSVPPFQNLQLASPGIHTVLNSFEVFGGPHTLTVGVDHVTVPRQQPRPLQGLDRRVGGGERDAGQGGQRCLAVLDRGRQSQDDRRKGGGRCHWCAGEVDDGARKHHAARRIHALRGLDQGDALELEGSFFPEIHALPGG
jgi:hypothetical protein